MKECLVVVDMQKDFVSGVLGTKEAKAIVSNVVNLVKNFKGDLIFTRDTHDANYMETMEGKKLPVPHCIKDTDGWQIIDELKPYSEKEGVLMIDKPTFGSTELAAYFLEHKGEYGKITLVGVCTDICVISNTMLVKASTPDTPISVIENCCAGVSVETHQNALKALSVCHIDIE